MRKALERRWRGADDQEFGGTTGRGDVQEAERTQAEGAGSVGLDKHLNTCAQVR